MMKIKFPLVWIVLLNAIVLLIEPTASITVSSNNLRTTTKPKIMKKSANSSSMDNESQITSADNRFRRLIPYMSFYVPTNDYNYPINYVPMYQPPMNIHHMKQVAVSPHQHQIPNVALLYGSPSKYATPRPAVQAGFLYKARPDQYKNYAPPRAVLKQPIMEPSFNSYKYQSSPPQSQLSYNHKATSSSKKNNYTPFLPSNQLPGHFVPIFEQKNLPYSSYEENLVKTNGQVRFHSQPSPHNIHKYQHKLLPLGEDDFIPMKSTPAPLPSSNHYHHRQHYNNNPPKSIYRNHYHSKNPSTPSIHQQSIIYSTPNPVSSTAPFEHTVTPNPLLSKYHHSVPTVVYPTTSLSGDSYDYDEPLVHQQRPIFVTTPAPIEHNSVRATTYTPDKNYYSHYHKVQDVSKYQQPPQRDEVQHEQQIQHEQQVEQEQAQIQHEQQVIQEQAQIQHEQQQIYQLKMQQEQEKLQHERAQIQHEQAQFEKKQKRIYQSKIKQEQIQHDKQIQQEQIHQQEQELIRQQEQEQELIHQQEQELIQQEQVQQKQEKIQEQEKILQEQQQLEREQQAPIYRGPTYLPEPSKPTIQLNQNLPVDLGTSSKLGDILKKLQDSNHLPKTLTPDNIDNSINTLVKILDNLKQSQTIQEKPEYNNQPDDYDYNNNNGDDDHFDDTVKDGSPGPNSGRPGIDYPNYHKIPETNFTCKDQRYKGFFGDPDTSCQVWHYCDLNGGKASFLCPNGTIFSQVALTCDWWFNVKCSSTAQLYVLNERLYKYILPFTPKFPEDYSGPLVDKYLALKFKEMEEKMQREKQKGREEKQEEEENSEEPEDTNEAAAGASEDTNEVQASNDDTITFTPGPILVPENAPITILTPVPELPPLANTEVESTRLEIIEIKNVGTSGHLTHNYR